MSLQVWLPLNGNLKNQGLRNVTLGTITAPAYTTQGKIGSALTSGTVYMTAADTAAILNNNEMSFAFWIYVDTTTGDTTNRNMIFGNGNVVDNNNRKFSIFQYPSCNDLHLSWQNDAASTKFIDSIEYGVFPSYQWTHCIVTYKNPSVKIYINGQLKQTYSGVSNSSSFAYQTYLMQSCDKRRLNDYRIYDHCLSPAEVHELAQGLVLHYPLNNNAFSHYPTGFHHGITLSDNSKWIPILVHNNVNGSSLFKYSDSFETGVYYDETKWAYFNRLNTLSRYDANYEFLVKQQAIYNDTYSTVRFRQTINPLTATWNTVGPSSGNITWITGGGSAYGGMYKMAASSMFMCFSNTSNGNWFGCGASQNYQGGIPSVCNSIAKGYQIVYMRVSDAQYTTYNESELKMANNYIPNSWDNKEFDISGYGYTGTKTGNIAISQDTLRYDCCYNIVSPQFILSEQGSMTWFDYDKCTVSIWLNPTSTPSGQTGSFGIQAAQSGSYKGFAISNYAGKFTVHTTNGSWVINSTGSTLTNGTWYHLAATLDGTTLKMYMNGQLVDTKTISWGSTVASTLARATVNNDLCGSPEYGNSRISDFRIYSTALSASDIHALYMLRNDNRN